MTETVGKTSGRQSTKRGAPRSSASSSALGPARIVPRESLTRERTPAVCSSVCAAPSDENGSDENGSGEVRETLSVFGARGTRFRINVRFDLAENTAGGALGRHVGGDSARTARRRAHDEHARARDVFARAFPRPEGHGGVHAQGDRRGDPSRVFQRRRRHRDVSVVVAPADRVRYRAQARDPEGRPAERAPGADHQPRRRRVLAAARRGRGSERHDRATRETRGAPPGQAPRRRARRRRRRRRRRRPRQATAQPRDAVLFRRRFYK